MTIKEVCQFFWSTEEKHQLLSPAQQQVWLPLRFSFYYFVTKEIGLFEKSSKEKISKVQKLKSSFTLLYYFLRFNPWLAPSKEEVLFPSSRKVKGIDIYSNDLMLEKQGRLVVIDSLFKGQQLPNTYSFDYLYHLVSLYVTLVSKFSFLRRQELPFIRSAMNDFQKQFKLNRDKIQDHNFKLYLNFQIMEAIFYSYFRLKKFKRLYIVGAYFRMEIISAAKRAGVDVVELQHGTITPYHLGYSYPGNPDIAYFPDELQCHGKFWYENTPMPSGTRFTIHPANFITKLSSFRDRPTKHANEVVFNSQGVIGSQIFAFSYQTAKICPELKIIFRLHPNEDLGKYQKLLNDAGGEISNFSLSHRDPNIFALMADAEYVAGAFSTTLFEAMYMGSKIIVIDMTGVEYMEPVLQRGEAILVKTPEDFKQNYKKAKISDAEYYYAEKASS